MTGPTKNGRFKSEFQYDLTIHYIHIYKCVQVHQHPKIPPGPNDVFFRNIQHTQNLMITIFSGEKSEEFQSENQVDMIQGIVGCTPTNVPLWEIPI